MQQKIWGSPIWIFFHSLANDISELQFLEYKNQIIKLFYNTCKLLPCPICRNHAIEALEKAYIQQILTKNDFIIFLIQFHNLVNIKKNVNPLTLDEVNEIYNNISFPNTVNNFINVFKLPLYSKDLHYGLKKKNFIDSNIIFINKLKKNICK